MTAVGATAGVPRLVTDRLILREWRDADRAPYAALNADPEVMRHFPSTLTARQSDEMVERIRAGWAHNFGLWAVQIADAAPAAQHLAAQNLAGHHLHGQFIGFIGFAAPSWTAEITPCVEIGWRLARHAWGNGYAPEGARAALAWAFENIDLPRGEVVSFTTVDNSKSRRVMDKIGLRHDPSRDFDHPLLAGWAGARHVLYCIDRHRHRLLS